MILGRHVTIVLAFVSIAGCASASDERMPTTSSTTVEPSSTTVAGPASPELVEDQRRRRDDIVRSIELLRAHPGVDITYQSLDLDGAVVTGTVRIDQTTGDYSAVERIRPEINPEAEILSERVLVGTTLFARFSASSDDPDTVEWGSSVIDDETFLTEVRSVAYTALGGAGGGLDRLVLLLDNVEWRIEAAATTDVDGRTIDSVLVGFESPAVAEFLRTSGLERTAVVEPDGRTLYEFWIDASTGELDRLLAGGVQFQDGEPIEGAAIEIDYTPIASVSIESPLVK